MCVTLVDGQKGVLDTTLCPEVHHWLADVWNTQVSSIYKADRHDIMCSKMFLKVLHRFLVLVGFVFSFLCSVLLMNVLFHLAIVLSVFLRFTTSDWPSGIFKRFSCILNSKHKQLMLSLSYSVKRICWVDDLIMKIKTRRIDKQHKLINGKFYMTSTTLS